MKKILVVIASSLIIIGCSSNKAVDTPIDLSLLDEKNVATAQNLFRCSSFFDFVTGARKGSDDPLEHTKKTMEMASTASEIAEHILISSAEGKPINSDSLIAHFKNSGNLQAREMVKEIGFSNDPNIISNLFQKCFKTIQREELFDIGR
ncbi:MAG: hypothetical protein ACI8SK_001484 [Shewanella sp.]|jgi:hypothetical protein